MEKIVIGAPFGNYLGFGRTTRTFGTFTWEYRGGPLKRLWRVLKTVRYYPGIRAWKNKLGLPNPGILGMVRMADACDPALLARSIVSVSGRNTADWVTLFDALLPRNPGYVELNVSCPNCPGERDSSDYGLVFKTAVERFGDRAVVKLPPLGYRDIVGRALLCGVRSFHCCNTLPTPGGGLSGKPLKALSLDCLAEVASAAKRNGVFLKHLIGGGGVSSRADAEDYFSAGATSVSVASALFFPWKWLTVSRMAEHFFQAGRAAQGAGCGPIGCVGCRCRHRELS